MDKMLPQPPELKKTLHKVAVALQKFDDHPGDSAALHRSAVAFDRLFDTSLRNWLESMPATAMTFTGTFPSMKIPVRHAQVLAKLESDRKMPVMGFGTRCVPPARLRHSVRSAFAAGYRNIDVVPGSLSEIAIGQAIASHIGESGVSRDEIFVTLRPSNVDWATPSALAKTLALQLETLHVGYADLYLLPGPAPSAEALARAWSEFEAFFASGKARSIGVANVPTSQLESLFATAHVLPHVVQDAYNMFASWGSEVLEGEALDRLLRPKNILFLAHGMFHGPHEWMRPLADPHVKAIATAHGKDPAQVLLRWALQRGMSILACSGNEPDIFTNANIFGFELAERDMAVLSHLVLLAETVPGKAHRPPWKLDMFSLTQASSAFL